MTDKKWKWNMALVLLALFGLLLVLLKTTDVQAIGPAGSEVGLATLNGAVKEWVGVRLFWYQLTDWLGVAAVLTALGFAGLGFCQLVHRRGIRKVDADIILLGGFYAVVFALYLFFEVWVVNCRPILMDGQLEASFPSSHTMIVLCILGSAMMQFRRRVKKPCLCRSVNGLSALVIAVTVIGWIISCVHWFTDILGGLLLGGALLLLYAAGLEWLAGREDVR